MNHRTHTPFASVLVTLTVLLTGTATAHAWPEAWFWHHPANGPMAGGGGYYGMGSATDRGVRCSHCHVTRASDPRAVVTAMIDAVPAFGDVGGERGYVPGRTYRITIRQIGNRVGPMGRDINGIAATIENAAGRVTGELRPDGIRMSSCPTAPPWDEATPRPASWAGRTTAMYGDCHGVLSLGEPRETSWTFDWVAPAAGSGPLTLYLGLVDGGVGGLSSYDDDVFERAYPLHEM